MYYYYYYYICCHLYAGYLQNTYLKATTSLGYIVLQLFFLFTICATCNVNFPCYAFCTFTCVLSEVCVQCPLWLFFSSLFLCSLSTVLSYFMIDIEMVIDVPGIARVFTFHMLCISSVSYSYFRIFSASFLNKFLSP